MDQITAAQDREGTASPQTQPSTGEQATALVTANTSSLGSVDVVDTQTLAEDTARLASQNPENGDALINAVADRLGLPTGRRS